jgi:carboxymethylenebutenolidase
MERNKASDFPQELLNLFDEYVHGGMSRRQFLDRAQKFAVGGVTAATLFDMLRPNYARAIQVPADDKRIKAEYDTVRSPQGDGSIKGYLVRPANATNCPPSWSSTRIVVSIRISKMWRGGWRSPTSSHSRPTG